MKRYRTDIVLSVFILTAIVLVYGQLRTYGFLHYDDLDYVVTNPQVQAGLTWEGVKWAFISNFHWQWHPVTWLSHMMDVQFFGMKPGRHHLVSLFFHAANSLLLFFLFRRTTGAPVRSAMVAILFALHPLHVEPVAMVADRKDLLSTFFLLLCLHAYAGFARKGGYARYGLVFLLFVMGLMSKAVVVTLPILLLLLDAWPLGRVRPEDFTRAENSNEPGVVARSYRKASAFRLILEKLVLLAPMVIVAATAILVRNPGKSLFRLPTWHHVQNGLVSYVLYIGKTLWPSNLAVIYPAPGRYSIGQVIACGLLLLVITAAVLGWRKRRPWLAVGWLWYLLTLLPVIGILGYMGPHQMADRYAYVPATGLFIMAAWGAPDFLERWRTGRALMPALAGGIVFVLMAAAWLQVGYWKNSIFLFAHAARVTDGNYEALNNLGLAYITQGNDRRAEEAFRKALGIRPDFVSARLNLGVLYKQQGAFQQAEEQFREALTIAPDNARAHNNLGLILIEQGRLMAATNHLRRAVALAPGQARMRYSLGNALLFQGEIAEAVVHLSEAVKSRPDFAEAHRTLGHALGFLGNVEAAAAHFETAQRINPSYGEARENLQRVRSMMTSSGGNTGLAVEHSFSGRREPATNNN